MSPQQLAKPMPTSDHRTRAIECPADHLLLPQVRAWASNTTQNSRPDLDTIVDTLFLNAVTHAHGPVRLVIIQHTSGGLDLAVIDNGSLNNTSPTLTEGGGLAKINQISEWGWYGDQRGHTVWARLPPRNTEAHPE